MDPQHSEAQLLFPTESSPVFAAPPQPAGGAMAVPMSAVGEQLGAWLSSGHSTPPTDMVRALHRRLV